MCIGAGSIKSKHGSGQSSLYGLLLMCGYLGFDGFTSTWQDKMFKGYQMSIYNQILYVQLCSACVSTGMLFIAQQVRLRWNIQTVVLFCFVLFFTPQHNYNPNVSASRDELARWNTAWPDIPMPTAVSRCFLQFLQLILGAM